MNEKFIIISVGIVLALIGTTLGIIVTIRSAKTLKKAILFLTIGMAINIIYSLINIFELGTLVLGNYEYLVGIVYIIGILFFVLAMICLEKMINKIDEDISREKFQRKIYKKCH